MEEQWYAARAALRHLQQKHPNWSYRRLAEETGYSYNWVRKWCHRFDQAEPDDPEVLCSGHVCIAGVDAQSFKPGPIPDSVRSELMNVC